MGRRKYNKITVFTQVKQIYLVLINDPLLKIKRLSYFRDNSVIFFESSYLQERLRPRCWIKKSSRCSSFERRSVRPLKFYMIWVQTGVSQVGFYLLINDKITLVRKDWVIKKFLFHWIILNASIVAEECSGFKFLPRSFYFHRKPIRLWYPL